MALRVWLPLNGNLNNQGLSNQGIITTTPAYTNGKIGQCLTTGGLKFTALQAEEIFNDNGFSYCCWIYIPVDAGTAVAGNNCFFGRNSNPRIYSLFQYPNVDDLHLSWIRYTNSEKTTTDTTVGGVWADFFEVRTWIHLAVTYKPGEVKIYKNGELFTTLNKTIDYTTYTGFNYETDIISSSSQRYLNDVRVYDECLSQKQIKEISKGLVAHYKLETSNINTNLAVFNPLVNSGSTSISFDRSTNTYTLVAPVGDSTWGYGANIGTTKKCIVPYNSYYRFSFEVYVPTEHELVVDYNNYSNDSSVASWNGNDNDLTSARLANTKTIPANTWTKCTFGSQNAHASNTSHTDIYEQSKIGLRTASDTESVTWYLRNFKFELDNKATDYVPYGYDPMEFLTTDVSGNGYNSIINGTLTYNNDSSRYGGCTKFDANTSYIKLPALTTGGFANSFTFIWWSNIIDMNGRMAWGFSDGNRLNLYPTSSNYCCNTGDGGNNPYKDDSGNAVTFSTYNNGWHQYAMVGDGTTNKLYIDGQYKGKATTYKGITGTQIYISGWDASTSYTWTNGQISDWRLYATVLSADEILTMYKTSGIIDNKQIMYGYEFKEV